MKIKMPVTRAPGPDFEAIVTFAAFSVMIVITGAAGFIGSCTVGRFNAEGVTNLVLVDDFSKREKEPNYSLKTFYQKIERKNFLSWFRNHADIVTEVIHLGARTDTTEFDVNVFNELNLNFSKDVWRICADNAVPLIYASSAATYGLGEEGYADDESLIPKLKPLNPYGDSKNEFDKWVLLQRHKPPRWYGLKFFNVYGPNEYHKGRMASVVFHAFNQIRDKGEVKLFRSHYPRFKDGEQLRDFVYVKDVADVIWFLHEKMPVSGIFNLGSGKARTFLALAESTFAAMNKKPHIEFIDTPADIRDKYQYFTEADMSKLRAAGYRKPFTSLEEGIRDYVTNYLLKKEYY
jgi:ADP-L-glycero-D-manno-heptose 6-epimerase